MITALKTIGRVTRSDIILIAKKMKLDKKYALRMAELNDEMAIGDLLNNDFSPYEIINMRVKSTEKYILTPEEEILAKEGRYTKVRDHLESGSPSIVVVLVETNEIVGVNIPIVKSDLSVKNETKDPPEIQSPSTKPLDIIHLCLAEVSKKAAVHEKFPEAKKALYINIIVVNKNHRRQGLAHILIGETVEWAKRNDVDLVYGIFTSPFLQKATENMGFKSVLDYDLQTFRDSDGRLVFPDTKPHDIISVMAIEIKNKIS